MSSGEFFSLGSPLNVPTPSEFGVAQVAEDIQVKFQYNGVLGGIVQGRVNISGDANKRNNLVLAINSATGEASIHNDSLFFDAEITAYTIDSTAGRLRIEDGSWNSFADQNVNGWDEADNSSPLRLTEFNPLTELLMGKDGGIYYLWTPIEISGNRLTSGEFTFEFLLSTGAILEGVVELGALPVPNLPGDSDGIGIVELADFSEWRFSFGKTVTTGSSADGNKDGTINAADFVLWCDHLNVSSSETSLTVPELGVSLMVATLIIGFVGTRCQSLLWRIQFVRHRTR